MLVAPFVAFAQTATTSTTNAATIATTEIVDPGLVHGDFFYFLDRWGEVLNTVFTFNKEKKARLHLEYAKERVAEMKDVLKNPNAKLEDVASTKENFDTQIGDAAALVKDEKDSGADVALLARELDDELDSSHRELKEVLREHRDSEGRAEAEIRAKIEAITAGNMASGTKASELQGLTQALESITKEKNDTKGEEDNIDTGISDEQSLFENIMGPQMAAEKHMEQAIRLHNIESTGGQVPEKVSEELIKKAQEALRHGDFEGAKHLSQEAEHAMEKAKEMHDERGINEPGTDRRNIQERGNNNDVNMMNDGNIPRHEQESEKMMEGSLNEER